MIYQASEIYEQRDENGVKHNGKNIGYISADIFGKAGERVWTADEFLFEYAPGHYFTVHNIYTPISDDIEKCNRFFAYTESVHIVERYEGTPEQWIQAYHDGNIFPYADKRKLILF